jgi:hypothetical protein
MNTNPIWSALRIATLALFLLTTLDCWSASFTLNPSADAFVTPGSTGSLSISNFGVAGALGISAPGSPKGEFQSVMQFNLAGAKNSFDSQFGVGQWTIQSVTLTLSNTSPGNAIFNSTTPGQFTVSWMQNDGWTEGNGTPQTPSPTGINFSTISNFVSVGDESLGTFSYNGATSGTASYSLGLTSGFSADASSGNLVSFRFFAADSLVSYLFDSENFTQASGHPVLTIVAVPEPAAVALGIMGLSLLARPGWLSRHKQR